MKIDNDIIGKYALHSNGFGPVMKIVSHDLDNNLNLRYKCEWKENCLTMSSLFKLCELDIFLDTPPQSNHSKTKPGREKKVTRDQDYASQTDHLGNPVNPVVEKEIDKVYEGLN